MLPFIRFTPRALASCEGWQPPDSTLVAGPVPNNDRKGSFGRLPFPLYIAR
jgi:hypothetical protein